jgi:hypothetical protein
VGSEPGWAASRDGPQESFPKVLDKNPRYTILIISRLVTEGCLISIFRRGAGSGGRGMTFRWRCGEAARRSKPRALRPAHAAGRQAVVWRPCRKARRLKNGSPPGALRSKPHKHRARDALGLADLRHYRFRQASMSRGVEARGSDFGSMCVPRALGTQSRASGGMGMRPTRGRTKNTCGGALAFGQGWIRGRHLYLPRPLPYRPLAACGGNPWHRPGLPAAIVMTQNKA